MCYAKQLLKKFGGIPGIPRPSKFGVRTQAEQLHSGDQAAIVIEGAAVTSKPTEVSVRAVSLRKKPY